MALIKKFLTGIKWLAVTCFVAIILLLIAAPFYVYEQFDSEYPVAQLEFRELAPQQFIAELRTGDFCAKKEFLILGDQWQLDASFLKWQGLAVILGFDSKYRLDRLSGRYRSIDDQNTRRILAHQLSPAVWFDLFANKETDGNSNFLVDTAFGSSVYLDINTHNIYTIYRTEDALLTKATDRPRVVYKDGPTIIHITHACADGPGVFERLARIFNRVAITLF